MSNRAPVDDQQAPRIPDIATLRAIADAPPEELRVVPLVAAGLGLRPGEVNGLLSANHVDFLRGGATVTQQLDGRREPGPLLTSASYHTVPLPTVVGDAFSTHVTRTGRTIQARSGHTFAAVTLDVYGHL